MLGFAVNVSAASSLKLSCDKTDIRIGESTVCTVSFTSDTAITSSAFALSTSRYLDISNVKPNTTKGWSSDDSTNPSNGYYAFKITSGTGVAEGDVFSFTVTLNSKAKELGEKDTCGELCISKAVLGSVTTTNAKGTGTCFMPNVVEDECPEGECPNPETGAFANYAIIAASILVAGAAVIIARKSTKFFRV